MKSRVFHVFAGAVFGLAIAIACVTRAGSAAFVAPSDRIATFDNDGTL